jgi:hypothetical protein
MSDQARCASERATLKQADVLISARIPDARRATKGLGPFAVELLFKALVVPGKRERRSGPQDAPFYDTATTEKA